jgi:uridine kinase
MLIIGISGGTASGKTTLVKKLSEHYNSLNPLIISQDSYYHQNSEMRFSDREKINFDHPDAIDFNLLTKHIENLKSGKIINIPTYSFLEHNRTDECTTAHPSELIIVEGILLFNDKRLVNLFDLKFFIEADSDLRFIRRVKRDIIERGRDFNEVSNRYISTLKPMHELYIEPTKEIADLVIRNNNNSEKPLETIIQFIQKHR